MERVSFLSWSFIIFKCFVNPITQTRGGSTYPHVRGTVCVLLWTNAVHVCTVLNYSLAYGVLNGGDAFPDALITKARFEHRHWPAVAAQCASLLPAHATYNNATCLTSCVVR